MATSYQPHLVGVFGFPVAENPTVVMHEAAFAAAALDWRYLTIEVRPEGLVDAVRGMRAMGFEGVNLTIPHKVAVLPLLDEITPDAAMIGAVNTVRRVGGKLIGENTDGKGFLRGVREEARMDPAGKRVVILGAGGAARSIAVELALAGAADLLILNRSRPRKKSMLRDLLERTQARARFEPWTGEYRVTADTDILVNATFIGLYPDITATPAVNLDAARPHLLVCDVIPNPPDTRFLHSARARGLPTLDGLAMLVYQGAIAFKMWTGRDASEPAMKAALRQAFAI